MLLTCSKLPSKHLQWGLQEMDFKMCTFGRDHAGEFHRDVFYAALGALSGHACSPKCQKVCPS